MGKWNISPVTIDDSNNICNLSYQQIKERVEMIRGALEFNQEKAPPSIKDLLELADYCLRYNDTLKITVEWQTGSLEGIKNHKIEVKAQ